jgi:ParB-like nuclease domain
MLTATLERAGQAAPGSGLPDVSTVPVADLSMGYSPRQTKLDPVHVAGLMEVVDQLPPVIVNERTMTIIDGAHRLEAFRKLGRSHIEARLFSGNELEALVIAIEANVKHGKPLSRTERQAAAGVLLSRYPDRSDRWVGHVCGLSHTTVAVLRQSLRLADVRVRTGRDGRRRPLDPVPGRVAVVRVMTENPGATVREAAKAAGVAPSTVHRVASSLHGPDNPSSELVAMVEAAAGAPTGGRVIDLSLPRSPELDGTASWLAQTAVTIEDLPLHLGSLPLSRVYEVADECRRRAHTWGQIAEALEQRARRSACRELASRP